MIRQSLVMGVARLCAAVGLGALGACAGDRDPPPGEPSFYRSMASAGAQLDADTSAAMISGYRRNNNLTEVTVDPELMRLAETQARGMATRDKLDHNVVRGFSERLKGYDAKLAVENIGAGYHTLAEAFSGWRDSPPHRANMLKSGVTRLGIAAVYAPQSKYKVFWALILAAPDDRRT